MFKKILYNFFAIATKIAAYFLKTIYNFFAAEPSRSVIIKSLPDLPLIRNKYELCSPGLTADLEEHFLVRVAILNDYQTQMLKIGERDDVEIKQLEMQRDEIMSFDRIDNNFSRQLEAYLNRFAMFKGTYEIDDSYQKLFAKNYPKLQKHVIALRARSL